MADHFINTRATTFWKAVIIEWSRNMAMVACVIVAKFVDGFRRDSGFDMRPQEIKQLGIEAACCAHLISLVFIQPQGFE